MAMPWKTPPLLLLLLLSLAPTTALGQDGPWYMQGTLGLTVASFGSEGTDAPASVGVQLGFSPRLYRVLAAHLEGGIGYLGRLCFEVGEACEASRRSPSSSETFMLSGAVAVGMLTPPFYLGTDSEGVDVAVGLFAGREWIEAGIGQGDCLNCRVSGLGLQGGFYVEPTLELWFFPGMALGAAYRLYSTDSDLHRRFTLRILIGPTS